MAVWRSINAEKNHAYEVAARKRNREKILISHAKWRADNREKVRAGYTEWCKMNPERIKAQKDKARIRTVVNLCDRYVKQLISANTALSSSEIPDSLVRLKRAQIKLHREVKKHDDQERGTT